MNIFSNFFGVWNRLSKNGDSAVKKFDEYILDDKLRRERLIIDGHGRVIYQYPDDPLKSYEVDPEFTKRTIAAMEEILNTEEGK